MLLIQYGELTINADRIAYIRPRKPGPGPGIDVVFGEGAVVTIDDGAALAEILKCLRAHGFPILVVKP